MRNLVTRVVNAALASVMVAVVALVAWGLWAGYRPVVVTTASMTPSAPPGTLLVARPEPPADIGVGDILVMRREDGSLVSHRVVSRQETGGAVTVTTQGDANPAPDPVPYVVAQEHLVARWVVPGFGRFLLILGGGSPAWYAACGAVIGGLFLILFGGGAATAPAGDPATALLSPHPVDPRVPDPRLPNRHAPRRTPLGPAGA